MSSLRGYILTIDELEALANITVTDETEAWEQISAAEELIDAYVGYQEKGFEGVVRGQITAVNGVTITDSDSSSPLFVVNNTFQGCHLEIVGGLGAGQIRRIVSSNRAGTVTLESAFTTTPDITSVYKIYQLGKFPRECDYVVARSGDTIYKSIPDAVRKATAYQVAFALEKGADYFTGDGSEFDSENIGNYSYNRGNSSSGQSALIKLIAPRARTLLRSIKNRTGRLLAEDPTREY